MEHYRRAKHPLATGVLQQQPSPVMRWGVSKGMIKSPTAIQVPGRALLPRCARGRRLGYIWGPLGFIGSRQNTTLEVRSCACN